MSTRATVRQLLSARSLWRSVPTLIIVGVILWLCNKLLPNQSRQPFWEATCWSLLIVTSFVGWGSLVAFIVHARAPTSQRDERIDLGLRMAWGAGAMAFIGGVLMVPSLMNRGSAMLLVEVGIVLAIVAALREREDVWRRSRLLTRLARREPRLAIVALFVVALLAIHYLGGIAEWHTDPYDDDIAYLTFIRKLLDTGSFPEPFSFRRLSALGSQTFFQALVAKRASTAEAHTFDRAICILMTAALIVGHRSKGRRPSFLFTTLAVLLVPLLPLVTRNMSAHYSAIAFFVALFRTVVWAGERPERSAWKTALPIALVGMVVCTLRQNYLPIPVFFLFASYASRLYAGRPLDGAKVRALLVEPVLVFALTLTALAPWFISAWQSNHTFLFPLMTGTYNMALQLSSDSVTAVQEVRLSIWTMLEGVPLYAFGLFFVGSMLSREPARHGVTTVDPRRPLFSFILATLGGYALLIHALSLGDPGNVGRYAVGFVIAGAIATALTVGLTRYDLADRRAQIAAGVTLLALVLQLGRGADSAYKFYGRALQNIDSARADVPRTVATERFEAKTYEKLQLTVPEGQRMAVLLDEPHYFDFARNPIWNLDMPGYSSLPPKMPFFLGSEKLEQYFHTIGVRYLAFVAPDQSRYQYRREYWVTLLVDEMEIWRTYAPYVIDFVDNLVDIARRHRHMFEKDGMVLLDLEAPLAP